MSRQGTLYGVIAALLFGLSTPLLKGFLGEIHPVLAASILYLGAGSGCMMIVLAGRFVRGAAARAPLIPGSKNDWLWLAGAVLVGGGVAPVLFLAGLKQTDAAFASLLLNTEGVATVILAWTLFREHLGRRAAGGIVAILAGAAALSWGGVPGSTSGQGPLLILGACLCWGIDNNLTRKVSLASPLFITTVKGLVAGTMNLLLALKEGAAWPGLGSLCLLGTIGFVCYGLSLCFFVLSLRHLGTARTGAYFSTAPFIGAVLSVITGQGDPTARLLVGGVLMAAGVGLTLSEEHAHEHDHPIRSHEHRHAHDDHHLHDHDGEDPGDGPHCHPHRHDRLVHAHTHYPDMHHEHTHRRTPGQ